MSLIDLVQQNLGPDNHGARRIDHPAADDTRAVLSGNCLGGEQEKNLGGDDDRRPP